MLSVSSLMFYLIILVIKCYCLRPVMLFTKIPLINDEKSIMVLITSLLFFLNDRIYKFNQTNQMKMSSLYFDILNLCLFYYFKRMHAKLFYDNLFCIKQVIKILSLFVKGVIFFQAFAISHPIRPTEITLKK